MFLQQAVPFAFFSNLFLLVFQIRVRFVAGTCSLVDVSPQPEIPGEYIFAPSVFSPPAYVNVLSPLYTELYPELLNSEH